MVSSLTASSEPPRKASWANWLLHPFSTMQAEAQTVSQQTNEISPEQAVDQATADKASNQSPKATEAEAGDQSEGTLPMAGTWQKDESASDAEGYATQIAMLHMSSLYTYAALHYMWGVELTVSDQGFSKKYLVKHVPAYIFSEVEHFKFGETTTMNRRDRRNGSQEAIAQNAADSIACDIKWGDPFAGTVKENYQMPTPQVLRITSTLTIGDQTVTSFQVYNKQ